MEILPPNPRLVRKYPVPRPFGNPTGPMSLVNPKDGYPAISAGLRRSASDDKFVSSATLAQAPRFLNVPPGQLAQAPQYLNVPPGGLGQSPLTTPMVNQPALDPAQIRDLSRTYAAENFAGDYVDQIKMNVRYDYGENPYFGYSTARRNAQFENPSFMASSYNYPDIFQRRGVSLAGLGSIAIGQTAEVTASSLNVRSTFQIGDNVIGSLSRGQRVAVSRITQGGEWAFISAPGIEGWVSAQFLKPAEAMGPPASGGGGAHSEPAGRPSNVPSEFWNALSSVAPTGGSGLASWWNSQPPQMQAWWVSFIAPIIGLNPPPIPGANMQAVNPNAAPPGLTAADIAAAQARLNQLPPLNTRPPARDNTGLYIGLGVAGLVVLSVVVVLATRK